MKLTLQMRERRITIEINGYDHDLTTVRDDLLRPLILAAGFHPDNVNELFGEEL